MVVSLKANKKRILAFLVLAAIVVGACIFLQGGDGGEEAQPVPGGTNEERIAYLQGFGWEIDTEPVETREVMIPAEFNDVYTAYNVMQKAQGFDLKPFAGEVCTQYKYKINNYPDEPEAYATLLVYGEEIIGGDISCAEVDGFMHGFASDSARYGETNTQTPSSSQAESSALTESSQVESSVASTLESSVASSPAEDAGTDSAPQSEVSAESTGGEAIPEEAFPTD